MKKDVSLHKQVPNSKITEITTEPTVKEMTTLQEIKKYLQENKIESNILDDWMLMRFVRAKKADYNKTLKYLTNYLNFRKEYDVDNILNYDMKFVGKILATMGGVYWHVDKQGRPYCYIRATGLDADTFSSIKLDDHLKYETWLNEKLIHSTFPFLSKVFNKRIDKVLFIQDLKGLDIKKHFDQRVSKINFAQTKQRQEYYPEMLAKHLVINAPKVFKNLIFPVIKMWMDKKTREKILVYGEEVKYEEVLLNHIDEDKLADFLGGRLKNPLENPLSIIEPPWKEYEDRILERKNFFINGKKVSDPLEASEGLDVHEFPKSMELLGKINRNN